MRITFESVQEHNIQSRGGAERMHAPVRDEVKKQERAGAYSVNIGAQDARAQRDGRICERRRGLIKKKV